MFRATPQRTVFQLENALVPTLEQVEGTMPSKLEEKIMRAINSTAAIGYDIDGQASLPRIRVRFATGS
jgi:hypothetical protein